MKSLRSIVIGAVVLLSGGCAAAPTAGPATVTTQVPTTTTVNHLVTVPSMVTVTVVSTVEPPEPTTTMPTPFTTGTCLTGTIPDSTDPVPVPDVTEVECSSDTAHYRVIQNFPGTTDMTLCQDNPDTQYVFSSELTNGRGIPIDRYVYCLIGLGDHAR